MTDTDKGSAFKVAEQSPQIPLEFRQMRDALECKVELSASKYFLKNQDNFAAETGPMTLKLVTFF